MNYQRIAREVRNVFDQNYSKNYRDSDELEVQSDEHVRLCETLRQISISFGHAVSALDLGCGTGRYFHCLQNVERLVAIDVAIEMLKQARSPVKGQSFNIRRLDLICANGLDIQLFTQFDFIYSIGVLGEHAPWDVPTCNRLFDLLKPGGKLFFTVVDVFSRFPYMTWKRRLAETVNLVLPSSWKGRLRERLETFYMTERELTAIFKKSKFGNYESRKHVSTARLWTGAHYECVATKPIRPLA